MGGGLPLSLVAVRDVLWNSAPQYAELESASLAE